MALNVDNVAREIAFSAARERVKRSCALHKMDVVLRLLVALQAGLSNVKAARAAGLSEATLRLWLTEGQKRPESCYGTLRAAVDDIREGLRPAPKPAPVQLSGVTIAGPVALPAAAAPVRQTPPSRPQITLEVMGRYEAELRELQRLRARGFPEYMAGSYDVLRHQDTLKHAELAFLERWGWMSNAAQT